MKRNRLERLIIISILAALSFILMLIQFPIPFIPPFLTVDFSDIPAFIGFILFGGVAGSLVIIMKIVLYGLLMASEPIGPLANMLAAFSLLLPIYFIHERCRDEEVPDRRLCCRNHRTDFNDGCAELLRPAADVWHHHRSF